MGEKVVSARSQKLSRQIMKDVSDIFQKQARDIVAGAIVSVTVVRLSPDLSFAKVYLSIYPFSKSQEIMDKVKESTWLIRREVAKRMKNHIRNIPELAFYQDDSIEYAENIESVLKVTTPQLKDEK